MKILKLEELTELLDGAYVPIAVEVGGVKKNYKVLLSLIGGGGDPTPQGLDETLAVGDTSNRSIHLNPITVDGTDSLFKLSVGIDDYSNGVQIRSKRKPNGFIRIVDNGTGGDPTGLDAITFEFYDGTGARKFVFSGREFRFDYGSTIQVTSSTMFFQGPTGENLAIARRCIGYDKRFAIQRQTTGFPDVTVPVTVFSDKNHVSINGAKDTAYRANIFGEVYLRGGANIMPFQNPHALVAVVTGTTGSTTIVYRIVGRDIAGNLTLSTDVTVTTANDVLSSTNCVVLLIDNEVIDVSDFIGLNSGTSFYDIYRVSTDGSSPTTTGKIKTLDCSGFTATTSFYIYDTGLAGDGVTIPVSTQNRTGNLGIGTTTPEGVLDLNSTTRAFYPPRMTEDQRDAMVDVGRGAVIYNLTTDQMNYFNGSTWITY